MSAAQPASKRGRTAGPHIKLTRYDIAVSVMQTTALIASLAFVVMLAIWLSNLLPSPISKKVELMPAGDGGWEDGSADATPNVESPEDAVPDPSMANEETDVTQIEEVIELSREAAAKGGFYTSHLREEGLGLLEGVQEAIVIAEQAEIPVVLTHHKVVGYPMWGSSVKTLAMVDSARAAGLDVMIDQYPYTASFTGLSILIPAWSMAGGPVREFARRCQDPVLRDSIKRGIVFNLINDRGGNDLSRVQFSSFPYRPEFDGKTLRDWAEAEGLEPTMENGAELIIEAQINGGARCIFHAMDEGDVARIMQHPQTMIASDGRLNRLGEGHPHPRVYGTFPRVLGLYVREKQLLTLEEAIRKMSGLPAQRLGLTDRGLIKAGFKADLVIFDPQTVQDQAGFTDPHHFPIGIPYVLLNGRLVVDDNTFHDLRAGKVLRGPAYQSGK